MAAYESSERSELLSWTHHQASWVTRLHVGSSEAQKIDRPNQDCRCDIGRSWVCSQFYQPQVLAPRIVAGKFAGTPSLVAVARLGHYLCGSRSLHRSGLGRCSTDMNQVKPALPR